MSVKPKLKEIEVQLRHLNIEEALSLISKLEKEFGLNLENLTSRYNKKRLLQEKEILRFKKMCKYEADGVSKGFKFIAGVDEAGRGPLAGPVVAAAVILPEDVFIEKLNDSKLLSPQIRDILFDKIKEKAVSYGVGIVDEKCIDEINILNATKKAMQIAINSLNPKSDLVLIDAVKLDSLKTEQLSIIKGDSLSISIAAASIIAKVTRDRMIEEMDLKYPQYGFAAHKGYGTKEHIEAIKKFGICPIHRVSFTKNFV